MLVIHRLGCQPYELIWNKMKVFVSNRTADTTDELWLLEHHPVYTLGQAAKKEHVLNPGDIPLVQSDRGGQVTYHGPGQMIGYFLFDLQRRHLGIRTFVRQLEEVLIKLLTEYDIKAQGRCDAPGVYVGEKKIASIGLRVKNGYAYHGIALNVDMDLTPFAGINPCGYAKMPMTQISDYVPLITFDEVMDKAADIFIRFFC